MLSFGEKELRKFGWTEGKGLGVGEDGITEPIIVVPKGDNKGVGYAREESRAEFDNEWWKQSYNRSVASVVVSNKEDEVKIGREVDLGIVGENSIKIESNNFEAGDTKRDVEVLIERDIAIQEYELVTMCKKNESSKHCSSPCGKQKRIAQQEAKVEKKSRSSIDFEFYQFT